MSITGPVFADDATPDVRRSPDEYAQQLFERFITKGPHIEYRAYEARVTTGVGGRRRAPNVWEFIDNAVHGSGGFSNGAYLFPFKLEVENNQLSEKLARRMVEADYDRFAEHICMAAFDLIVSAADMIDRKATGEAAALLSDFWANVDNRGTSIIDFLEIPVEQSRMHGPGWIFMDRPDVPLNTKADNFAPGNRPYIYNVPTQYVVDWDFDDAGELIGIVVLEPSEGEYTPGDVSPVRVWTKNSWAFYRPNIGPDATDKGVRDPSNYVLAAQGVNELGMVPAVPVWNKMPNAGKIGLGTEMLDVARIAQTVYNLDSESRDIERKCALFLAVPVKNTKDYDGGTIVLSADAAFTYDGDAGKPEWVSPDLAILKRIAEKREKKKADAYQMAGLGALAGAVGTIQTKSGFHAEVEFAKTERRVARFAGALENAEKRIAILFLKFYGIDAVATPDLFTITYPRDYGVRDMQKIIDDATAVLDLNVGEEWQREEFTRLARARFPRKSDQEIQEIVDDTIATRAKAQQQQDAVSRVKAMASAAKGVPQPVLKVDSIRSADFATAQGGGYDGGDDVA